MPFAQICPHVSVCVEPDARDEQPSPVTEAVKQFIAKYFKGVSTTLSVYEPCIITVS